MFIQMSFVSLAGDGRDVFFGGRAAFFGLQVYCMVFCIPLFWGLYSWLKNCKSPQTRLGCPSLHQNVAEHDIIWSIPPIPISTLESSIQSINVKCDWLSALTTHWVTWSREKDGFTSQRNLCYGHKLTLFFHKRLYIHINYLCDEMVILFFYIFGISDKTNFPISVPLLTRQTSTCRMMVLENINPFL